jgi:hypothetical protein
MYGLMCVFSADHRNREERALLPFLNRRTSPVTLNLTLDWMSLELLPALTFHRAWLHDQFDCKTRVGREADGHDECAGLRSSRERQTGAGVGGVELHASLW